MNNIFSVLFISIMVLVGMMFFSLWYMNFVQKVMVGRKHELIESILETSSVPNSWVKGFPSKSGNPEVQGQNALSVFGRRQKRILHRLDGLIKYLESTRLVESEEVRKDLLAKLQAVRKHWESEGGMFCENQIEPLGG
jgi:hypothetical protein